MILYDLLAPKRREALGTKVLGYGFLSAAALGGTYFLFQELVPLLGYAESGTLVSLLLGLIGGSLLFMARERQPLPQADLPHQALSFFRGLDVESTLKENAVPLALTALVAGLALSQVNKASKLLDICKIFMK